MDASYGGIIGLDWVIRQAIPMFQLYQTFRTTRALQMNQNTTVTTEGLGSS